MMHQLTLPTGHEAIVTYRVLPAEPDVGLLQPYVDEDSVDITDVSGYSNLEYLLTPKAYLEVLDALPV